MKSKMCAESLFLQEGHPIVLGEPMKKWSTFQVHRAILQHQPNEYETKASVYHFSQELAAIGTDNTQCVDLTATTLYPGSGITGIEFR